MHKANELSLAVMAVGRTGIRVISLVTSSPSVPLYDGVQLSVMVFMPSVGRLLTVMVPVLAFTDTYDAPEPLTDQAPSGVTVVVVGVVG